MINRGNKNKMKKRDDQIPMQVCAVLVADKQSNDQQTIVRNDRDTERDQSQLARAISETMTLSLAMATEDFGCTPIDCMARNRRLVEFHPEELDLSTTPIINDIETELRPIAEYAKEPLLPLYKACAPLVDILNDLYAYIQVALDETPDVPSDGLTFDESAAIRLYTMEWQKPHRSLYVMLNQTLRSRNGEHLRPYFKYMKLFITALVKLPCVPQSTVWRGVARNVSEDFPPNSPITFWTFSSCTAALPVLESNTFLGNTGERTLLSVEAINGRKIHAHSHFSTEDEILLLPGTHMIVQSKFSPAPNLHIIHLKQIIPDQVLLEPPFPGTLNTTNYHF